MRAHDALAPIVREPHDVDMGRRGREAGGGRERVLEGLAEGELGGGGRREGEPDVVV